MQRKHPGALLAIVCIGIGIGALGGCLGVYTVLSSLSGVMEDMQQQAVDMQPTEEQREFQRELTRSVMEVQARYRVPILAHQGVNILASLVLVIACISLARWRKSAPTLMTIAVAANAFIDLGGGALHYLMQQANNEVVARAMRNFDSSGGPPGMDRTLQGVMGASAAMGVCWLVVMLAFKLGYYFWAVRYVRKPAVRELLTE